MKKIIICFSMLLLSVASYSQQTTTAIPTLSKTEYLQKSKKQKTTAWILLGVGTIAWVAGASKYMNQNDNKDGGGEVAMVIHCTFGRKF